MTRRGDAPCAGPPRGQLRGIDHDCNDIPDAAMTLAVAALFAEASFLLSHQRSCHKLLSGLLSQLLSASQQHLDLPQHQRKQEATCLAITCMPGVAQ